MRRIRKMQASSFNDAAESITNRVRELRRMHGLSQQELASKIGVTRQALSAIESSRYTPGTEIALKLARELRCSVEELFTLQDSPQVVEADYVGAPESSRQARTRVKLAYVGSRLVARPVAELGDSLNFMIPADGLLTEEAPQPSSRTRHPARVHIQLLRNREMIKEEILVAGCDPAIYLAGEYFRNNRSTASVVGWTMGSTAALQALQRGEVHIAGLHVMDYRSGECNIPFLRQHLRDPHYAVIRFASWEEGLMVAHGNPKHIERVEDLGHRRIRLVNREPGSGARRLLDHALAQAGIAPEQVTGTVRMARSHLEVGRLIAEGLADVGIGTQAVARYFDLEFLPLQSEYYDLVIPTALLKSHPALADFLDTLTSRRFRAEIQALGGYDTTETGKQIEWMPAPRRHLRHSRSR
ncbi:MAG: helix-turn-helix domain-containing protein [Nitrospirae bacterium]|nr:MAG: helix-turn-helix domain-containing protein [Nitrospirota bacterium]